MFIHVGLISHDFLFILFSLDKFYFNYVRIDIFKDKIICFLDIIGSFKSCFLKDGDVSFNIDMELYRKLKFYIHKF